MMLDYFDIYKRLKLPDSFVECALGRITIPIPGWESPAPWYGFPPALVPLAAEGSGPTYLGVWKPWFTKRNPTFVKMYLSAGRLVVEVARTAPQLFSYLILQAIGIDDGISPEIEKFAARVGIQNLTGLDQISLKTGDDPKGLATLAEFANEVPFNSVVQPNLYTGDFPTGLFSETDWCNDACSFELSPEVITSWPESNLSQPSWLRPGPKKQIFEQFLKEGNLHNAWLTLNSSG